MTKETRLKSAAVLLPLLALVTVSATATGVFAHERNPEAVADERGGNHENVKSAIEAGDYEAFVEATSETPFAQNITPEFFASFTEANALRETGDIEGAKVIMDKLGLKPHKKHGKFNEEKRAEMKENHEAMRTAIEMEDYDAFVEAAGDAPFIDEVTPEFFEKFIEAHTLRETGDFEGAKAVMNELGLKPHEKQRHHEFKKKQAGDFENHEDDEEGFDGFDS
jgi:hypothetical protein